MTHLQKNNLKIVSIGVQRNTIHKKALKKLLWKIILQKKINQNILSIGDHRNDKKKETWNF